MFIHIVRYSHDTLRHKRSCIFYIYQHLSAIFGIWFQIHFTNNVYLQLNQVMI
jgi:hypothetical protein